MSFLPERPRYARERLRVGYPTLAVLALLLLCRILDGRLPFRTDTLPVKAAVEVVVFLLPGILYLVLAHRPLLSLRPRPPRLVHLPLLAAAAPALFFGCLLLSLLSGGIGTLGNSAAAYESPAGSGFGAILAAVPVLALLPAVCEEFFFRGILVAEYERRGAGRAVFMSALLFAAAHFDLRNLPVYLFSGALLALALLASDSLPTVMLLHALYNIASLFGQRYLHALYRFTGSVEIFLLLLVLVFLVSLSLFCLACAHLYRLRAKALLPDPRRAVPRSVQFYTTLDALSDPPVLVALLLAVVGIILFF